MIRVVTVAREFSSGGALIAHKVAEKMGWNLLDHALVDAIAQAAKVDPSLARRYDERCDSWLHRVSRLGLWHGAPAGAALFYEADVFDGQTMAALGRSLITEAHARGNCVTVGRGAQCVLQDRPDVLHVFIYAPWHERVARARKRLPDAHDVEELIRATDQARADFIRLYFGCDWKDLHLYHMLINSELGEDTAAQMIVDAIRPGNPVPHAR